MWSEGGLQIHEICSSGWCTGKWWRLDRTIGDITCGDLEILHLVIRLGVTEPKKTELLCLLDLLGGRGKKGWCDLVYI